MASFLLSSFTLNFVAGVAVFPNLSYLEYKYRRGGNKIGRFFATHFPKGNAWLNPLSLLLVHPIFDYLVNTRPVLKLINRIYKREEDSYPRIILNNLSFVIGIIAGWVLGLTDDLNRRMFPWFKDITKFLAFPAALFDNPPPPPISEYDRTTWWGLPQEYMDAFDQSQETLQEYTDRLEDEFPGIMGPHGPLVTDNPFYD